MEIRDAQTLRLHALKGDVAPLIASHAEADGFIDLALVPGDPPKLWIDLTSYVVMAPDPRTFRLVQDTREGYHTIAETSDRARMVEHLTAHIAHRLVVRQRAFDPAQTAHLHRERGYSTAALILAWLAGFSLGVLALLAIAVFLGKTPY